MITGVSPNKHQPNQILLFCVCQSPLSTTGRELPLILPSKLGGYWIDPPLDRLVDVSPTSSHYAVDPENYDIMERDGEAKIYHEFFRSRVSRL